MNDAKRKRLEAKGWRLGTVQEFLGLSDQEAAFIEVKLKLARSLRVKRLKRGMGQQQAAKLAQSSQSRFAKMESADSSVSVDLLVRSHLALGTSALELGRIIARPTAGERGPDVKPRRPALRSR
ncbi:MAG: helix-turn-helix transcriptional regulator [Elusimicrobiota bacterium]|nr:MAG: helix-turn-helix transcriptional regulator [Elusimicrobiota bacterium]